MFIDRIFLFFLTAATICKSWSSVCNFHTAARRRCSFIKLNQATCAARGCCWDEKKAYCYRKRKLLQVQFQPSASPSTTLQQVGATQVQNHNGILQFGGEAGFPGSTVMRRCSASRGYRSCGSYFSINRNSCLRFGCCWRDNRCTQAVYNVIKLREKCPPGKANPPRCDQVDHCYSSPCLMGGVCINEKKGFKCNCPGNTVGEICQEGCSPPSLIENGFYSNSSKRFYLRNEAVTYKCNPGYVLTGFPINICESGGKWMLWGASLPTCVPGNAGKVDFLIILDNSDSLDNCRSRFSDLNSFPLFPGPILTSANFPNFFQQQQFVKGFETSWRSVYESTSQIALHIHAGSCNDNSMPLRQLKDTDVFNTDFLFSFLVNYCAKPNFFEILQCASDFHFTPERGDRPEAQNVIILVVPDVTTLRSDYDDILNKMAAIRRQLKATVFTISSVDPQKVELNVFLENIFFISQLACGYNFNLCTNVLGTIYDPPEHAASILHSALFGSTW